MTIKFSDGMEFDTSGDYRCVHRKDGWYVVGHGMLCAVDSYQDGMQTIAEMRAIDSPKAENS